MEELWKEVKGALTSENNFIARVTRWIRHLVLVGGALCLLGPPGPVYAASFVDASLSVRPFAGVPPATIVDLSTTPVAVEGQLRLDWTAPTVFPGSTLEAYQVRIQTISLASVGGSTTAWWNTAGGFTAQGFYGESPGDAVTRTLGPPGTGSDHTLALFPGATYYIAVRSADDVGVSLDFWSDIAGVAQASPVDLVPGTPSGLSATGTLSSIDLAWTDLTTVQKGPDFDAYQIYRSTESGTGYVLLSSSTGTSYSDNSVVLGTSYYYIITALDRGAPTYPGTAWESPPSSEVVAERLQIIRTPLRPNGLVASNAGGLFTVSWSSVTLATDYLPITLDHYSVYRYDAIESTPTLVGTLGADTLSYSEAVGAQTYYYRVFAVGVGGFTSAASDYVDTLENRIVVAADDPTTRVVVPAALLHELNAGFNGYGEDVELVIVRRAQDEVDVTLRSYRVEAYLAQSGRPLPNFAFSRNDMQVQLGLGAILGTGHYRTKFLDPGPGSIAQIVSVYWYNGAAYIRLSDPVLTSAQQIAVSVRNIGIYQVRATQIGTVFKLSQNSPYPRVITPNDPSQNNRVFWFFDNPSGDPVTGTIYDIRGAVVRDITFSSLSPTSNSLVWDGRDGNGAVVPSGVYLYKIQAGKESATGTVVVAR